MNLEIANGIWVTMVTPFTNEGTIDFAALEKLIDWYVQKKVAGLFAVCKSSESFELSLKERLELAAFVVESAAGRLPVIASGNLEKGLNNQVEEIRKIADTGVDAVVLISSLVAAESESDAVWMDNIKTILERISSDIHLGIYESPYPYKRIMVPELLQRCVDTGRFQFLKDTCCDLDMIKKKLEVTKGTNLKIFNAHTATLLESLQAGCAGYSSIMSNCIPELYNWLIDNYLTDPEGAEELQKYLIEADEILTHRCYPATAKYYLSLEGVPVSLYTRANINCRFGDSVVEKINKLRADNQVVMQTYGVT